MHSLGLSVERLSLICLQITVNVVIYSFISFNMIWARIRKNNECWVVNEIHLHEIITENWKCHHLNSVWIQITSTVYIVHTIQHNIIRYSISCLIVSIPKKGYWHANKVKCSCIQHDYYCTNWTIPTEMAAHCNGRRSQRSCYTCQEKKSMWLSQFVYDSAPNSP